MNGTTATLAPQQMAEPELRAEIQRLQALFRAASGTYADVLRLGKCLKLLAKMKKEQNANATCHAPKR